MVIVQYSLAKGRNSNHVQYETIRKFRAYSDFFERFNKGLHKRMGDIIRPDRAISMEIIKALMMAVDQNWADANVLDKHKYALEGIFYVVAFTLAFRGEEVPLIELHGISNHWAQGLQHSTPHVVITLLGHFKNEIRESYHLIPVLYTTPRGLEPGKWVERVLEVYRHHHIYSGYMFRNPDGSKIKAKSMEPKFHERLNVIQFKCYTHFTSSFNLE